MTAKPLPDFDDDDIEDAIAVRRRGAKPPRPKTANESPEIKFKTARNAAYLWTEVAASQPLEFLPNGTLKIPEQIQDLAVSQKTESRRLAKNNAFRMLTDALLHQQREVGTPETAEKFARWLEAGVLPFVSGGRDERAGRTDSLNIEDEVIEAIGYLYAVKDEGDKATGSIGKASIEFKRRVAENKKVLGYSRLVAIQDVLAASASGHPGAPSREDLTRIAGHLRIIFERVQDHSIRPTFLRELWRNGSTAVPEVASAVAVGLRDVVRRKIRQGIIEIPDEWKETVALTDLRAELARVQGETEKWARALVHAAIDSRNADDRGDMLRRVTGLLAPEFPELLRRSEVAQLSVIGAYGFHLEWSDAQFDADRASEVAHLKGRRDEMWLRAGQAAGSQIAAAKMLRELFPVAGIDRAIDSMDSFYFQMPPSPTRHLLPVQNTLDR